MFSRTFIARSILISLFSGSVNAGVMRNDIDVYEYRDFAENRGKYRAGTSGITVYKKDGTIDSVIDITMPDFSSVSSLGYATLFSPSYLVGVKHNGGYKEVTFGGTDTLFSTSYKLINRNNHDTRDFHAPRLNKVVTEAAPVESISVEDVTNDPGRYTWYARVGSGTQSQIDDDGSTYSKIANAYSFLTGGLMSAADMNNGDVVRWKNNDTTPLSIAGAGGDSGSPVFAWDSLFEKWVLVGVVTAVSSTSNVHFTTYTDYINIDFVNELKALNSSPDITDISSDGTIKWGSDAITQGANTWSWDGLSSVYNGVAPSAATMDELDATKDINFNGEGGTIELTDHVNLGAGRMEFNADYTLTSLQGNDFTWVGGGVDVTDDNTVLWQVNGVKNDNLHKIGTGTLHVNASGINEGGLNVGDGIVYLDQQSDINGDKQAFSTITLVSGRPVVVLGDSEQVKTDGIQFGYRGGTLDVNGNDLTFEQIFHNDDGAKIVNRNENKDSTLTLTGNNNIFLGSIGETDAGSLNLVYAAEQDNGIWNLAGGAHLDKLSVEQGHLMLSGQQVKLSDNRYLSDYWDDKTYNVRDIDITSGSVLTLSEHADLNLTGEIKVDATGIFQVLGRSTLNGSVNLESDTSLLIANIAPEASTKGDLASLIEGDIYGAGKFIKDGNGVLTVNGNIDTTSPIGHMMGTLVLNGNVSSDVNLSTGAVLGGRGTLGNINLATGSTLSPGVETIKNSKYSTLTVNNLTTDGDAVLILNSQLNGANTDRLLINGDVTTNSNPILINVNANGIWSNSDVNNNGVADNDEGVSLIQVAGSSSADAFKLSGEYVARGAWAYGLYAYEPGDSSSADRVVDGSGTDYWDYRLQNIMLAQGGNPATDGSSEGASRRAVTPQVPAYISLPSVLMNADKQRFALFDDKTETAVNGDKTLFLYNVYGKERFHSANDFMSYGYDYSSKHQGWTLGGQVLSFGNDNVKSNINLAYSNSNISFKPDAVDGVSRGNLNAKSFLFSGTFDMNKYSMNFINIMSQSKGSIHTDLRGGVGNINAFSSLTSIEGSRQFVPAKKHTYKPFIGISYQYLDIKGFTDVDSAHIKYDNLSRTAINIGTRYTYSQSVDSGRNLKFMAGVEGVIYPGKQGKVSIYDDYGDNIKFMTGKGGSNAKLSLSAEYDITDSVSLNSNAQSQQRLGREGTSDFLLSGGVKVTF